MSKHTLEFLAEHKDVKGTVVNQTVPSLKLRLQSL